MNHPMTDRTNGTTFCFALFTVVLLVIFPGTLAASSASNDEPTSPSVGVSATIQGLVLPGSELRAKPLSDADLPIVLRITNTFVHGNEFRYDIEYYGLEPGKHDLRDYLERIDGSSMDDLPEIPVTISSVLPSDGQIAPDDLEMFQIRGVGGYRLLAGLAVFAWVAGLLALIFVGRSKQRSASLKAGEQMTLADRLRPIVEAAVSGDLPEAERAELERLLLGYWHDKLGVGDLPPAEAIRKIRADEKAGELLTTLEHWLHSPDESPQPSDINALLEPYKTVQGNGAATVN